MDSLAFPYMTVKTFLLYGITELIAAFWVYSLIVDKTYRLNKKQILFFIPIILYIIWASIASVLAVNPSLSFWGPMQRGTGLLTLYHVFIFSIIIVSLINHDGKKYLNKLLKYFLFGSFILAISVWLGNEGLNLPFKIFIKSSGGGFVGNSSFTAAYFIFSLFFSLYILFEKSISKGWKIFTSIIFATILFSPLFVNIHGLFTGSGLLGSARGALLGVIIGVGSILVGYLILSKNKILKILGIVGIFISLVTFVVGWNSLMKSDTYLHNKFVDVASGNRFLFWNIAQKSMDEHPYFGYGPENFMIATQKNFDNKILDENHSHEGWNDKAHNIYFDIGATSGYPGIILYGVFLLSILYGIYKAYKIGRISQIQASVLGGMLIGYIFQNLFVFDSPVSLMALFMTAGIVYSLQTEETKEKYVKTKINQNILNTIAFVLSLAFIFSFVNFSYVPLKKSREIKRIMSLNLDKRPAEYMNLLNGGEVGNDWDASYFAYDTVYLGYSGQIKKIQQDQKIINYVDADLTSYLAYLNKLAETNKTDYRLYLTMLHLYNIKINILNKPYDKAEFDHIVSIADFAHSLSPADPQVYWDLGFLKYFQGDANGALEEYKKVVYWDKTNKVSWVMMLNFLKNTGAEPLYNIALKEAQSNIPGFIMK